jgi:hypothetical protein
MPQKIQNNSKSHKLRIITKSPHFSWMVLAFFMFVFGAIGGYILLTSHAAPTPPAVYTTTPGSFLAPNTNFSVQIRENSGTTTVNAIQANLSYPTGLLTLVSVDLTGSAFGTTAQNTSGSGAISLGLGTCGGCAAVSGDQLVATLNFKTAATGGAATVAFTSGTLLVNSTTNTDLLGGLGATAGFTVNVDTTAPTASITSPANGATLAAGSTVNVTASASDNNLVSSVDFYVDGTKVSTDTASPYTYSWNTSSLSLGSHTLQAKATDPAGNVGSSAVTTVTLADQTPPTVSITGPANNSTQKGTVTVNVTAADNTGGTGISKVEFYVDGVLKATNTASPYSFSWDTTTATNASHALTAKAYDGASNVTTSGTVNIIVDNSPPTTPGSFAASGITTGSVNLSWTASSDNNAVTGYRLTRNGTTIATLGSTTLSYSDTNLASSTAFTYTVVALDAAGNASTAATVSATTLTPKPGDINGDNQVNALDLSLLLSAWNTNNAPSDLNHDGTVNVLDLSILLSHWGT